jgi:hypothetical protein
LALSRRAALRNILAGVCAIPFLPGCLGPQLQPGEPRFLQAAKRYRLTSADKRLLEELIALGVRFFAENADSQTGLVKDRCRTSGPDERPVASIAATGFGLTALCVADARGLLEARRVRKRVTGTLEYLLRSAPQEHGFFYHFMNAASGERAWTCELSSIDSTILFCGVIMCAEYFSDTTIRRLAGEIVDRADWRWLSKSNGLISHGWKPESGFLQSNWDHYCELMMLYLLALGSSEHVSRFRRRVALVETSAI